METKHYLNSFVIVADFGPEAHYSLIHKYKQNHFVFIADIFNVIQNYLYYIKKSK